MYALLYCSPRCQFISAEYRGHIRDTYPSLQEAEEHAALMNRCMGSNGLWDTCYRPIPLPTVGPLAQWSGSPDPNDPDNFWIDDATGQRIPAQPEPRP